MNEQARVSEAERLRRWRLVLGGGAADGTGIEIGDDDLAMDAAMAAVYDVGGQQGGTGGRAGHRRGRAAGLGRSAPQVVQWLGDIRRYFPTPVVQVMQRDAIDRLDLRRLLLEPEVLGSIEPDLGLVTVLVEVNHLLPDETRATARLVVDRVLDDLRSRLRERTDAAVRGALARSARARRPRSGDIDWHRTVQANLRHYLPDHATVVPERLIGFARHRSGLARDVVIAVDQSGSMADSVVYASVFAAVLARIPALRTSLIAFDTVVTDLTPLLHDPVDVLFGVQLGGGTDIAGALAVVRRMVTRPAETVVVLVSDLVEGGDPAVMRARVAELVRAGVHVLCLVALSDDGEPAHDRVAAADLHALGATVMSCTPDRFPEVLAAALER